MIVVIRMVWVFPATYVPRLISKRVRARDPYPKWQHVTVVAWTGMRGVVSLAAALALPTAKQNGSPFPGRDLILFLTFVVIFATLVVQGLSLPFLIRQLKIQDDRSIEKEEHEARLAANREALARLNEIGQRGGALTDAWERLRTEYEDHIRQLETADPRRAGPSLRRFSDEFEQLSREALRQERETILRLRNEEVINDEVLRRVQRDIDLAEARLAEHQ
ncbi:MAG: cation:proton antiporter [Verrucomicrobiota bacterium]